VDTSAASEAALACLEFPEILDRLASRTRSPYGREAAGQLRPTPDAGLARERLAETEEMLRHLQTRGRLPTSLPVDARPLLDRLEVAGSILPVAEIATLLAQLRTGQEVRLALASSPEPRLERIGRAFPDLSNLIRYLDGKVTPVGELDDRCSTELLTIRRRVASLTARLHEELRSISSRAEVARVLQDSFVALRNNRHVLPIRIEDQGAVEGIVHALSSSGATVYVEPLATVALNNDLVRLKEEEEVEIRRILLDYADLLRSRLADLRALMRDLGKVDLLQARAEAAEEMRGVGADLATDGSPEASLSLRAARHPLLEASLSRGPRRVVPLDLSTPPGCRVLVVSGPNTGGKTVALKTVGLLAAMAQSGLFVPAASAALPVFRRILIDIGDRQSIPDSLSTFSARMANLSTMAREVEHPALVLLDEVGTGTDPEEGGCLGAAIVEFFRSRGAWVIATTHFQAIKAYAASTPGAANASMEFDETTLEPLYRMREGVPGRSGGIDIASRLGVPEEIVRSARERLPRQREMVEAYLASLRALEETLEERIAALEAQSEAARLREEERAAAARKLALDREARFAQELEEMAARIRSRLEEYLEGVTDREERRRLRGEFERRESRLLSEARALRPGEAVAPPTAPAAPLKTGDPVRVVPLRVQGVLERLEGDRATVASGGKRLSVARSDLEPVAAAPSPAPRPLPRGVRLEREGDRSVPLEINLIGRRVEEALEILDKYLDDAFLAAVDSVRVVHGMGTGRLRSAVRRFLETHPHVEGFSQAEEREGGAGATRVRIRS
jgi:DNA mismatch repair protein MutS2